MIALLVATLVIGAGWIALRHERSHSPAVAEFLSRPVMPALAALDNADLTVVTRAVLDREGFRALRLGRGASGFRARTPDGRIALVHCRAWRDALVGGNQVRRFADAIARKGASEGVLVSSGGFSDCAVEAAEKLPIRLLDGGGLVRRLQAL